MPVSKCSNGKYKIGSGKCMYDSKEKAEVAYKGYLAKKHVNELKDELNLELEDLKKIDLELKKIKKLIKNDDK